MELRLVVSLMVAAVLAWLILAKSDKQSVHILEGKLHRLSKDERQAITAWKAHSRSISVVQFVIGFCLAFAALVIERTEVAIAFGLLGTTLLVLGIAGRLRTFRLADRELG